MLRHFDEISLCYFRTQTLLKSFAPFARSMSPFDQTQYKSVKLSLWQAVETHGIVRRQGSYIADNRLTDGGEVSLMPRTPFAPRKISGTYFC
jgi:hypothetical protein